MSAQRQGSVRIGPISLFTLVITLCLAVLAVLSVATANAQWSLASRQASFTQDDYRNERAGQELLARIDAVLANARSGQAGSRSADEAAKAVSAVLAQLCQEAAERAGGDTAVTASLDGAVVTAHVQAPSKRCLDIEIELADGPTARVTSWKATTLWTEPEETLWTGGSK